jgi:hypothetical protein
MAREFTKNLFVMLVAIMIGVFIITYFVADIMNRSKIETLTTEHVAEIKDINSMNENFTDYYLQGSVTMDSAREKREVGNYHFDFARIWYSNALVNPTGNLIQQCIDNCTEAMISYQSSYQKFGDSKPYFEKALTFTNNTRYIEVLGYYISFAQSGENITLLRYKASDYLKRAAENFSLGKMENVTVLMESFNLTEVLYMGQLPVYDSQRNQIDGYLFFDTIRGPH